MLRNAVWNGMACDMTILPARICSICLCNPRAELRRPNPGVAPASHTRTYTRRTPVSQWRLIAVATSWALSWRHPPPLYLVYKGLVPTFPFSFLIITFCFLSFVQFCCLSRFQPFRTQYVLYTASFFLSHRFKLSLFPIEAKFAVFSVALFSFFVPAFGSLLSTVSSSCLAHHYIFYFSFLPIYLSSILFLIFLHLYLISFTIFAYFFWLAHLKAFS